METVKSGLEFYALFKTYIGIVIGVLILCSAISLLVNIINSNYQKSPSSKIGYYTKTDSVECSTYEVTNNLCDLKVSYTDGTTNYNEPIPNSTNTQVGATTVFYQKENPKSYMITPSPYIFPGGLSCVACLALTFGIIRLLIIRSSSDAAAIVGGLDAAGDVYRIFRK